MRKKVDFLNDLYITTKSENLKIIRNNMRNKYRVALKRSRINSNDMLLKTQIILYQVCGKSLTRIEKIPLKQKTILVLKRLIII